MDLDSHTLEREDPFCCGFNAKVLAEETVEALEEMMIGVPPLLADMKSKKPAHADDLCFTISAFPHEDLHLPYVRGNITSALNDPTIDPLGMKQMPTRRVRKTSIVAVRLFGLQVQGGDVAGGFPFPLLVSQDDRFEVEGPGGIEEAGELTYLYGDDYWVSLREADLRLEALRDNM